MLHWYTAGESHGPALVALMEGMPAGVAITTTDVKDALARRRAGYGRGARQKFEQDRVRFLAGVRHGVTTGAPIAIEIANSEWPKWEKVMSADPVDPSELLVDAGRGDGREMSRNKRLSTPRPGHADLAGMVSYRTDDARNILERASARETAARVALGALARALLTQACGVEVLGHVVSVGDVSAKGGELPAPGQRERLDSSPVRTLDPGAEASFVAKIDETKAAGDTIAGVIEVVAWNVPSGLGSHVTCTQKLDAALAGALMSIQSAKAVEIGDGFETARRPGSRAHDAINVVEGSVGRETNRAGGIEGGTSNGQPIVARVGFKPISTVPNALPTVDLQTGLPAGAFHQRSDTSQVVPAAVIAEAAVELVLAQFLTERFGARSLPELQEQLAAQEAYVRAVLSGRND